MFFRPSAVLYAFQPISLSRRFLRAACFDAPIISHPPSFVNYIF